MSRRVSMEWCNLHIAGDLVEGDTEGDPEVPGGVREIPAYLDDLCVLADSCDEDTEITQYLNDEGIDFFVDMLIDNSKGGNDE